MDEDRALLGLARDLAETAETAAAEAKSQGATAKDRSYAQNVEQYNRLAAEAKKKYPESGPLLVLPESIEPVREWDKGPAGYLSPVELNKHIEVADASRRLVMALEATIGAYPEGTQVLQALSFDFIATKELKQIAERDKTELATAYQNKLWKCVILLCGGLAEGMLCDNLRGREQEAQAQYKKQWPSKKQKDLMEWDLYELTTVASDLGQISTDAPSLVHTLRGWRNLVHPGKEARTDLKPEQDRADIAVRMIRLLARDLSGKGSTTDE